MVDTHVTKMSTMGLKPLLSRIRLFFDREPLLTRFKEQLCCYHCQATIMCHQFKSSFYFAIFYDLCDQFSSICIILCHFVILVSIHIYILQHVAIVVTFSLWVLDHFQSCYSLDRFNEISIFRKKYSILVLKMWFDFQQIFTRNLNAN